MRELVKRYDSDQHEQLEYEHNKALVGELGLPEYLADRFAVVGTTDDCIKGLRAIANFDAVDAVLLPALMEDDRAFIKKMGTDVFPVFD